MWWSCKLAKNTMLSPKVPRMLPSLTTGWHKLPRHARRNFENTLSRSIDIYAVLMWFGTDNLQIPASDTSQDLWDSCDTSARLWTVVRDEYDTLIILELYLLDTDMLAWTLNVLQNGKVSFVMKLWMLLVKLPSQEGVLCCYQSFSGRARRRPPCVKVYAFCVAISFLTLALALPPECCNFPSPLSRHSFCTLWKQPL